MTRNHPAGALGRSNIRLGCTVYVFGQVEERLEKNLARFSCVLVRSIMRCHGNARHFDRLSKKTTLDTLFSAQQTDLFSTLAT